jgi:RNA recognition motif-containing protein
MTKTVYVGNLPWAISETDIIEAFTPYGQVDSARVATDRDTGRSRGFAFVEMNDDAADKAIEALNGAEWGGRTLTVNEAKERPARRR